MKIINKPKALFVVLFTSFAFNANAILNVNSIGDDGNPNTVGNSGAKKSSTESVKGNQLVFNINNQSSSTINKVVVVNSKDKQLYSGKLNCKVNQRCDLSLGKITWQGAVYFKFYDAKNVVIFCAYP